MVNQLLDISTRTMIGMLPSIINSNNESIKNEFETIFDASINRLIKSLYNPNGEVKTHLGEFLNLVTDNIVINDISVFENNIVNKINHNKLDNRHYVVIDNEITPITTSDDTSLYCHNTGSIVHIGVNETKALSDVIEDLYTQLNSLNVYGNNISPVMLYGNSESSVNIEQPKSYTLDNSVLFANKSLLMKLKLQLFLYLDIADSILCTYYDYSPVITINDEYVTSITGLPNSTVTIKFEDRKKKGFYKIILSRKDKKYLRISKDELVRLKLICIENDPVYGTIWDVESYSVRNPEDISIVKK